MHFTPSVVSWRAEIVKLSEVGVKKMTWIQGRDILSSAMLHNWECLKKCPEMLTVELCLLGKEPVQEPGGRKRKRLVAAQMYSFRWRLSMVTKGGIVIIYNFNGYLNPSTENGSCKKEDLLPCGAFWCIWTCKVSEEAGEKYFSPLKEWGKFRAPGGKVGGRRKGQGRRGVAVRWWEVIC